MGEFFDWNPGPKRLARADLTFDLKKQLCATDPPLGPCDFQRVELDHAGRARAVLAVAGRGRFLDALAAAVGAVTAARAGHVPSDAELLSSLIGIEAFEWIVGACSAVDSGGLGAAAGDGFRGYEDVLMPANLCSAVKLRRAAALDELRD